MYGAVVASKLKDGNTEIANQVSVDLPEVTMSTQDYKGAGVMGVIDLPTTGQIEAMEVSISKRGLGKNSAVLTKPGKHKLTLTFSQDYASSNNEIIPQGCKIYMETVYTGDTPGSIEIGEVIEGDITHQVLRYEEYINGQEVRVIDKRRYIYRVNGVDYMAQVRSQLG